MTGKKAIYIIFQGSAWEKIQERREQVFRNLSKMASFWTSERSFRGHSKARIIILNFHHLCSWSDGMKSWNIFTSLSNLIKMSTSVFIRNVHEGLQRRQNCEQVWKQKGPQKCLSTKTNHLMKMLLTNKNISPSLLLGTSHHHLLLLLGRVPRSDS